MSHRVGRWTRNWKISFLLFLKIKSIIKRITWCAAWTLVLSCVWCVAVLWPRSWRRYSIGCEPERYLQQDEQHRWKLQWDEESLRCLLQCLVCREVSARQYEWFCVCTAVQDVPALCQGEHRNWLFVPIKIKYNIFRFYLFAGSNEGAEYRI